jgi:hypothetical protein
VRRACTGARERRAARPGLRLALVTPLLVAHLGCSLFLTQAPEPDIHPPPPCNTYLAAPVTDTILASASVGFMAFGVVVATKPCGSSCTAPVVGLSAVLAGALTGALFTTSAVVGYERTSGCRALEKSKGTPPAAPGAPSAFLLDDSPPKACAPGGDTPRQCPSATARP